MIEPKGLVNHYADCARAIREAGMSADRVAVVCPYYFFNPPMGSPQRSRFLRTWRERLTDLDHCVLDLHYYQVCTTTRYPSAQRPAPSAQRPVPIAAATARCTRHQWPRVCCCCCFWRWRWRWRWRRR